MAEKKATTKAATAKKATASKKVIESDIRNISKHVAELERCLDNYNEEVLEQLKTNENEKLPIDTSADKKTVFAFGQIP